MTKDVKKLLADREKLDLLDFIPYQYISNLYNKHILQGVRTGTITPQALELFICALKRTNKRKLKVFGNDDTSARVAAIVSCVKACDSGVYDESCKDIYSAVFSFLYLCPETNRDVRLQKLKRFLKSKAIPVSIKSPHDSRVGIVGSALESSWNDWLEQQKIEALFKYVENVLNYSPPEFNYKRPARKHRAGPKKVNHEPAEGTVE